MATTLKPLSPRTRMVSVLSTISIRTSQSVKFTTIKPAKKYTHDHEAQHHQQTTELDPGGTGPGHHAIPAAIRAGARPGSQHIPPPVLRLHWRSFAPPARRHHSDKETQTMNADQKNAVYQPINPDSKYIMSCCPDCGARIPTRTTPGKEHGYYYEISCPHCGHYEHGYNGPDW